MSLLEITVSIFVMAAGVTVSAAAWTSSISQLQFARDLEAARICANNAAETLIAEKKTKTGQSVLEESIDNDSSCKIQIVDESLGGRTWEDVVVRSRKATVSLWLKRDFS